MSSIVDELNSLIIDLSNNKVQTDETDLIYYNIITQYNNYLTDISFSDTVDELIAPLTSPYNSINGKKNMQSVEVIKQIMIQMKKTIVNRIAQKIFNINS